MSALITPEALREVLPEVVLVDVQWSLSASGGPPGRDLYDHAHLPGAHFVDLDAELAGAPGTGGRHPLPTAHSVQEALRRCGVEGGSAVVVYDQGPGMAAARAWWAFRYAGLADVRVLDGGLAGWRDVGGATTQEVPPPGLGTFEAGVGGMPVLDADEAAALARSGLLLDARAAERYAGESEPIDPVAGHIPAAVNAPYADLVGPDGRLRPAEELRAYVAGLVTPDADGIKGVEGLDEVTVGAYCGSGITAAHTVLALHEAGISAALYVGSWSDWITDPDRPVATGRAH